tara:strand:+ start:517 stop:1044 length:528 start_codon:yes stop_codon:yes gene_type:complete
MANGTLKVSNIQTSSGSGTITIGQSGETITIPSGATQTGVGGTNTPNFKASNSGNTSCANNTFVKLSADTVTFDSDSGFASDKFTVPSGKGGKYIFTARVYFPNTVSTDYAQVSLYKNGGVVANTSHVHEDYQVHLHSNIENVSASDYFEIYFRHTAGSTQNAQLVEFSGFRLIE